MLILYYSCSCGNTERVAKMLQDETGADIEKLDTKTPYSGSYDEIVDIGKFEVETGFEPEINDLAHNIDDYDIIAIGTPTWWYQPAPAIMSLIHKNDWTGKIVVPFMTNGGWPGNVIRTIKSECVGASFTEPFEVQFDSSGGNQLVTSPDLVRDWAKRVAAVMNK